MGEQPPLESVHDGDQPSPMQRAFALSERQAELLVIARALIAEYHERPPSLTAKLRARVHAYTRELRDDGVPPERVLALVKTAVTPAFTVPRGERRELMELVVHWCVEAYYAA